MELLKFTQCTSNLNFEPLQDLKLELTPTAYEGELLNGFCNINSNMVLNYQKSDFKNSSELIQLIKCLYGDLSYIELLRMHLRFLQNPQFSSFITTEVFFTHFGFKFDENLELTNKLVLQLPKIFCNWCAIKKWGPQDFAPIRSFAKGLDQLGPFLEKLNNPLSKNEGTQIFELLVELLMLGKDLNYLLTLDLSQWLSTLKQDRYPLATLQNKKNEEFIQKNSWPIHSQPKWIRKGDKSGVELKLFFSNPQELERSLSKLTQIKTKDLWSID